MAIKIAVIPGDGIGWEVVPEGIKVLEAVGAKHGLDGIQRAAVVLPDKPGSPPSRGNRGKGRRPSIVR